MAYWGNRSLDDARATLAEYARRTRERSAAGEPLYIEIDPLLGWRLQPSSRHARWPYSTDALGNRRSGPKGVAFGADARRIAIAGNSYVHGDEASDEETWVWLMQARMGERFRLHNLGVTAYSTDQAFLRLQEFAEAEPIDIAVLTFTSTDVYRNLNMCRAFIMNDFEVPLFKPRFLANGAGIELLRPPATTPETLVSRLDDPEVRKLLREHDRFYPTLLRQGAQVLRRFRVPVPDQWQRSLRDGIGMTLRICDAFIRWCSGKGIRPVLLMLPVYWGSFPVARDFDLLSEALTGSDAAVIDTREVFTPERRALPRERLHRRFNHFTPESGGWLADHIASRLAGLA